MTKIPLILFLLLISYAVCAQTGNDFKDFDINGSKMTLQAVSMKVEDRITKKIVFDGYKQAKVTIQSVASEPTLSTINIDLGGYFSLSMGTLYQLSIEYKESGVTTVTYTVTDGLDTNKMGTLTFFYVNGELKSVWVITLPDIKNTKKGLTVTLSGLEMNTEK